MKRFSLNIHKKLASCKIHKSTKEYSFGKIDKYWAILGINLMLGISAERLVNTNWQNSLDFGGMVLLILSA